ncbi:class I SAM-dependent methyltransferase, partial [Fulvivirga kasyanovii]
THYPDILTGKVTAVSVMFPDGSKTLVEGIYKGNPLVDHYNELVAGLVKDYASRRGHEKPLHILEVGAGTGGTSKFVLEALSDFGGELEYHYTDISGSFTAYGKDTYGSRYPFMQFSVLNAETDPLSQGYESGSIDLILATNVIHATSSISRSLCHLKQLLKGNGLLVLNELTRVQSFSTLTFGLTDGWWRYEDGYCREPHSPILRASSWEDQLREAGFRNHRSFGIPGGGQLVMISESDGIIERVQPKIQ